MRILQSQTLRECLVGAQGIACYETTSLHNRQAVCEWALVVLAAERLLKVVVKDILATSQRDVIRCLDGVAFS